MSCLFPCCSEKEDNRHPIYQAMDAEKKTSCGRTVGLCDCISSKTVFAISTLAGVLFLAIGLLALAGYFAPAGGGSVGEILRQIQTVANCVATKLGSDLLALAIFTSVFGFVFSATGIAGLALGKGNRQADI